MREQEELSKVSDLLSEALPAGAVKAAYLNELSGQMPTLELAADSWLDAARLLKHHDALGYHYLRNISGVDYEEHMEAVYHLLSMQSGQTLAIKVAVSREGPSLPSVSAVWPAANWNEREIYDLLGIQFREHPDLRRIMMPDDWVGYPLRKDYKPLDSEV